MIFAAIEGQLLVILLMALFGFISWLSSKLNPGEKKPPQAPGQQPSASRRRTAPAETEEERMRRFLEALGLPGGGEMPSPPVAAPPPLAPRPKPVVAQAPPRARSVPPPPIPAPASLDELETTPLAVEAISLPEPAAPEVRPFETVASRITAAGSAAPSARQPAAAATAPTHSLLRAALASPQSLRTAFLLREILGPPPGLGGGGR